METFLISIFLESINETSKRRMHVKVNVRKYVFRYFDHPLHIALQVYICPAKQLQGIAFFHVRKTQPEPSTRNQSQLQKIISSIFWSFFEDHNAPRECTARKHHRINLFLAYHRKNTPCQKCPTRNQISDTHQSQIQKTLFLKCWLLILPARHRHTTLQVYPAQQGRFMDSPDFTRIISLLEVKEGGMGRGKSAAFNTATFAGIQRPAFALPFHKISFLAA